MRFVSLTVAAHTIEREKRMSKRRMLRLDGFVWDRLLAVGRGSEESVWCLLTGRWEVAMGRGGNVVSAVGGGNVVSIYKNKEDIRVV